MPKARRVKEGSRIAKIYEPVQPTFAQSTAQPGSRIHKPTLDEMTVGRTEVPVGREMPKTKPDPLAPRMPVKTIDVETGKTKDRGRGRAKKTGRPGA